MYKVVVKAYTLCMFDPARRAGEKNNLAPILSEKIFLPGPKFQAPPEYQMDRA